eukprot:m.12118 g.12118  ORF g.12118 m.12118 type:complete len:179 (+) comp6763_c0_seq1:468-1004(+)
MNPSAFAAVVRSTVASLRRGVPQPAHMMLAQQRTPALSSVLITSARQYHENVLDHYENPRNVGSLDKKKKSVGTGIVGAPACGDVMKLQIEVDDAGRIVDAKFKTFGCGSAIASSSLATVMLKGKTLDEAMQIKNTDLASELRLPPVKLHCSMLAEDAIQAAIRDFKTKNESLKEASA